PYRRVGRASSADRGLAESRRAACAWKIEFLGGVVPKNSAPDCHTSPHRGARPCRRDVLRFINRNSPRSPARPAPRARPTKPLPRGGGLPAAPSTTGSPPSLSSARRCARAGRRSPITPTGEPYARKPHVRFGGRGRP